MTGKVVWLVGWLIVEAAAAQRRPHMAIVIVPHLINGKFRLTRACVSWKTKAEAPLRRPGLLPGDSLEVQSRVKELQ